MAPDPVLLFRFSALTFNGHRIHYDLPYATGVEKYPGLVVHGPLQALLLMQSAQRHNPGRRPARFSFRGLRPLFHFETLRLQGRPRPDGGHDLFTVTGDGHVSHAGEHPLERRVSPRLERSVLLVPASNWAMITEDRGLGRGCRVHRPRGRGGAGREGGEPRQRRPRLHRARLRRASSSCSA